MKTSSKTTLYISSLAILVVVLFGVGYAAGITQEKESEENTNILTITPSPSDTSTPEPSFTPTPGQPSPTSIPSQKLLKMSFLSQAPFSNWDALHEDACEEASLLMVKHFLSNDPIPSKDAGEEEIQQLVAAGASLGQGGSITLVELSLLAQSHYGLVGGKIGEASVENLKRELAAGNPVIVPAAGKVLDNPYFSNGGPNYHMLVIKGYDADGFITNDPGTRQGEDFHYSYSNMIESIHDWDPQDILRGEKSYLVFDKGL